MKDRKNEAAVVSPQFATRAELDALRSASALMLAQLLSCVTNSMFSSSRYFASIDEVCAKQPASVKNEVAALIRAANAVRTVDLSGNRNKSPPAYQPGYRSF